MDKEAALLITAQFFLESFVDDPSGVAEWAREKNVSLDELCDVLNTLPIEGVEG